eukprot:GHVQ01030098.1.p1 GENE.GHVQ01030098.1~~GHVQ01030098.1.p1  ORF type:complete len:462 (+),score=53.88 GHVQ01030098.1:310-1695(+)
MMDCQIPNRGRRLTSLLHSLLIVSTLSTLSLSFYSIPVKSENPAQPQSDSPAQPLSDSPAFLACNAVVFATSNVESQALLTSDGAQPQSDNAQPQINISRHDADVHDLPPIILAYLEFMGAKPIQHIVINVTPRKNTAEEAANEEPLHGVGHTTVHHYQGRNEPPVDQQHTYTISGKMFDAMSTAYRFVCSLLGDIFGVVRKMGSSQQGFGPVIEAARENLSRYDLASDHNLRRVMQLHGDMMKFISHERTDDDGISQLLLDGNPANDGTCEDKVNDVIERLLASAEAMAVIDWRFQCRSHVPEAQEKFVSLGRQFFQYLHRDQPFSSEGAQVTNLEAFFDMLSTYTMTARHSRVMRNDCFYTKSSSDCDKPSNTNMAGLVPLLVAEGLGDIQDSDKATDKAADSTNKSAFERAYSTMVAGLKECAPRNYELIRWLENFLTSLGKDKIKEMREGAPCLDRE